MLQFEEYQKLTVTKIRRMLRCFTELINRRLVLDKAGIAYEQFPLLIVTIQCAGSSMQEIARITNQDKAGILRGLRALAMRGLIEFKGDPDDRRKRLVFPTRKARRLAAKIMNKVEVFERELFQGIPARELNAFFSVAGQLTDRCIDRGATNVRRYILKRG